MKMDGMGSHHGICLEQSLTVSRPALKDFIVDLPYNARKWPQDLRPFLSIKRRTSPLQIRQIHDEPEVQDRSLEEKRGESIFEGFGAK